MQEVQRENDQNGVAPFPPQVRWMLGKLLCSSAHSSGFHAYLCFLKTNIPGGVKKNKKEGV